MEIRTYLIINVSEIGLIDFNQVLETSAQTLRKNNTETRTFFKWEGNTPSFVNQLTTKEGPYTNEEMIDIVSLPEWIPPLPVH